MEKRAPLTTYLKICTEYYDLAEHPYDAQAVQFYRDYARAARGPILEPMCGTGRFLIPMLQAGLPIEGFDASPYMLQALKNKYSDAPVWQSFVQDFTSDKLYDLIFVPYGSWGLMANLQDSKKSLKIMYDHLAPGGKLVVDIETVASTPILQEWHRDVMTRVDGSQIALDTYCTYDEKTQIFKTLCRYESGEIIETEDFQMYLYQFDEFETYLKAAGFSEVKKYQDYTKTPATDRLAPLITYECIK